MKYHILVKGQPMHPTGEPPYEFKTYQEAKDMVSMCYGLASLGKDISIAEVKETKD